MPVVRRLAQVGRKLRVREVSDKLPMTITAIAPWFGGKRNLAPRIVASLGKHSAYWEPFCGGLSVLLAKEQAPFETVNDLHGELVNLARVLAHDGLAGLLYSALTATLLHETLFHEAAERWETRGYQPAPDNPDLPRAIDFMLCSWFGRNGVAGTESYNQGFCVRYTANGGHAAKRWVSAVESIPAWHERLRAVTILNRDAFELMERIEDRAGTAIYLDPPYLVKGAKYIHDFAQSDHGRLAGLARRFKHARVVVSYYDHPALADLYPDWNVERIEVSKAIAHQGRRGDNDVRAVECLLSNQRDAGNLFAGRCHVE